VLHRLVSPPSCPIFVAVVAAVWGTSCLWRPLKGTWLPLVSFPGTPVPGSGFFRPFRDWFAERFAIAHFRKLQLFLLISPTVSSPGSGHPPRNVLSISEVATRVWLSVFIGQ
jgi:hypothetical protein